MLRQKWPSYRSRAPSATSVGAYRYRVPPFERAPELLIADSKLPIPIRGFIHALILVSHNMCKLIDFEGAGRCVESPHTGKFDHPKAPTATILKLTANPGYAIRHPPNKPISRPILIRSPLRTSQSPASGIPTSLTNASAMSEARIRTKRHDAHSVQPSQGIQTQSFRYGYLFLMRALEMSYVLV